MMSCSKGCSVHMIAWWLMFIGAINWGLVGLGGLLGGNWNVINLLIGRWPMVESVVYLLVGVSAVMMFMKDGCKMCKGEKM